VIMTIVARWRVGSRMSAMIDAPVALVQVPSRFVGEHDRRTPDRAQAIATRCRSRRRAGGLEARAVGEADPFERLIRAPVLLAAGTGVEQPVGDVLPHRGVFGQEELLEDEPDLPGPQRDSSRSLSAMSTPPMRTTPLLGRSSVPMTCRSVDLPDPRARRSPPARPGGRQRTRRGGRAPPAPRRRPW
jgi:hypothetical protein